MKTVEAFIFSVLITTSVNLSASETKNTDISSIISAEEFSSYKNVGDFIEHAPKVSIIVKPSSQDIIKYGKGVVKSLTGSDCDRDGKMDDNAKCNAVYYKLWMKYER